MNKRKDQILESLLTRLEEAKVPNFIDIHNQDAPTNKPHVVRTSFLAFLKTEFPYQKDWIHPVTYVRFRNAAIKEALTILKVLNPVSYKALWALWTTGKNAHFLASRFYHSPNTIRRQWEKAIDIVMVLLFYPDLSIELLELID